MNMQICHRTIDSNNILTWEIREQFKRWDLLGRIIPMNIMWGKMSGSGAKS